MPILREFLLRGGTATFDDFHGPYEWESLARELKRLFPDRPIVEVERTHPIYSLLLQAGRVSPDPGLGSFLNGRTWERAGSCSTPRYLRRPRPAHDPDQLEHGHGRRLGVVERGGLSGLPQVHGEAYRMGINEIVYVLTH